MLEKITKIMVETADGRRFQWEGEVGKVRTYKTYTVDEKKKKTWFRVVDANLRLSDEPPPPVVE